MYERCSTLATSCLASALAMSATEVKPAECSPRPPDLHPGQLEQRQQLGQAAVRQPPAEGLQQLLVSPELLDLLAEVVHGGGEADGAGHEGLDLAARHLELVRHAVDGGGLPQVQQHQRVIEPRQHGLQLLQRRPVTSPTITASVTPRLRATASSGSDSRT